MMVLVATGGAELVEERPGIVAAFGLPSETKTTDVSYGNQVTVILAALAVAVVAIAYAVSKGRKAKS